MNYDQLVTRAATLRLSLTDATGDARQKILDEIDGVVSQLRAMTSRHDRSDSAEESDDGDEPGEEYRATLADERRKLEYAIDFKVGQMAAERAHQERKARK